MKNGRPETYHEIIALKNAHSLEKYIEAPDPKLIYEVFEFILAHPVNVVKLNRGFMSFVDYKGETLKVLPIMAIQKLDLVNITRDCVSVRTPGSSYSGDSGGSSSNNNNNNNNNNNG